MAWCRRPLLGAGGAYRGTRPRRLPRNRDTRGTHTGRVRDACRTHPGRARDADRMRPGRDAYGTSAGHGAHRPARTWAVKRVGGER
eukprot:scaffold16811_cov97-Isochrysis_galbana.AAC.1